MQDLLQRTHELCSSFFMQDKGLKSQGKNVHVDSAPAVPGSPIPLNTIKVYSTLNPEP